MLLTSKVIIIYELQETKQQNKFRNPKIEIIIDLNFTMNSPDQATKEISKPKN